MKSLIIILSLLTTSAFASTTKSELNLFDNLDSLKTRCSGLNITKSQQADIVKSIVAMRLSTRSLRKDLTTSRLEMFSVISDESSTRAEADSAFREMNRAGEPLKKVRMDTLLDIQFNILSGEQRVKILKCLKLGK